MVSAKVVAETVDTAVAQAEWAESAAMPASISKAVSPS